MALRSTVTLLSLLATAFAQDPSASAASPTLTVSPAPSGAGQSGGGVAAGTSITASVNPKLPQSPLATVAGFQIPNLSELTSGAPVQTTVPLDTTYTQGFQPTQVLGAPSLPNPTLAIANYPALDMVPPTDSPQVQQWLSQIDFSRVPNYSQTNGVCADNQGAITDGRCWWTCGGCTRETDITECPNKLDWGISFDDGPSPYTPLLLDYLNEHNLKTTFFVVGSRVLSRPEMLQSEYASGHQISIHTWSHMYLTNLTNEQIVAELGWTRQVIKDVIGVSPNTFRPPYGDIDDRVRAIAAQMGMIPIMWSAVEQNGQSINFDTTDWNIPGGKATGQSSFTRFEQILNEYVPMLETGFIVLAHDIYQQTVDLAVGYVLPKYLAEGRYKLKSIIDCLGKPLSEAYTETSSNTTATFITSAASTYFQPNFGSATGSPVLPSNSGAAGGSSGASGTSSSQSGSAASGASSSGSAAKRAGDVRFSRLGSVLVALCAVGVGMAIIA